MKSIQILSKEQIKLVLRTRHGTLWKQKICLSGGFGLVLILFTGLHLGEMAELMWDDIDFQKRTPKVQCTLEYVKTGTATKTAIIMYGAKKQQKSKSSERTIPLNQTALNALWELKTANGGFAYVFSNAKGKLINPPNLN